MSLSYFWCLKISHAFFFFVLKSVMGKNVHVTWTFQIEKMAYLISALILFVLVHHVSKFSSDEHDEVTKDQSLSLNPVVPSGTQGVKQSP